MKNLLLTWRSKHLRAKSLHLYYYICPFSGVISHPLIHLRIVTIKQTNRTMHKFVKMMVSMDVNALYYNALFVKM